MFIGISVRRARKPECISAATERATARQAASAGHRGASGWRSARVSAMANESHTVTPSTFSAGTMPEGECSAMAALVVSSWSGITTSSNATPARRRASQPRIDQDE